MKYPCAFVKGGSRGYVTIQPVFWEVGKKGSEFVVVIPAGREFESSVPRAFWWIFSPEDQRYLLSACVHDYLLEERYRPFFAAAEWYDAALASRAPRWRSFVAAIAVASFTVIRRRKGNSIQARTKNETV